MPEIKHNFTKGKMNKDLDERLVPNGEYRDALNVQVSTSEGSDVGTLQNILGNSLVTGQSFLDDMYSIGSIADEKNDKLYYFVASKELVTSPNLNSLNGWSTSNAGSPRVGSGRHQFNDDGNYSHLQADDFILVDGQRYDVEIVIDSIDDGVGLGVNDGFNYPRLMPQSQIGIAGTYKSSFIANTTATTRFKIYHYPHSNANASTSTANTLTNGAIISYVSVKKSMSAIIEYDSKTNSITPVLVDTIGDVLKFGKLNNTITGINIIDDLLLWTDNVNEPKKINIARCKAGTDVSGLTHTNLIVEGSDEGPIKEEHITVIKKPPTKSPNLDTITGVRTGRIEGNIKQQFHFHPSGNSYEEVVDGDEMWIGIDTGGSTGNIGTALNLEVGDILRVYSGYDAPTINPSTGLIETPIARLLIKEVHNSGDGTKRVTQAQNNFATSYPTDVIAYSHEAALRVSVASYVKHSSNNKYYFELEQEQVGIFERKFPRFACRYKYEDNEYSSVGPFSEVVFFPGEFEYHPTEAYNKGMVNNLKELTLKDFVAADIPTDVVGIDLLYKNEFSPNIYVVKSIYKSDDEWDVTNTSKYNKYVIKTENVYAQIPSNQLIRPWDNVPKTALAQEVTGNRVVYGNYMQGYDLLGTGDSGEYKINPVINATRYERLMQPQGNEPVHSVKSQRTYNLGVVYGDKYGRETPVFTNESAYQFIAKPSSATANAIVASVETEHPHWAEYYKMYIKETANEYYNLPMGRMYDAKDGNVWISFPSIDRNKIDEDTYLILKKGVGGANIEDEDGNYSGNKAVLDEARYKVVAIENEAPDYIKTEYTVLAEITNKIDGVTLFGGNYDDGSNPTDTDYKIELPAEGPFPGTKSFTINKKWWEHTGNESYHCGMMALTNDEGTGIWDTRRDNDIYVSFSNRFKVDDVSWGQSPITMSNKYRVTGIELIPEETADEGYNGHDLYRITISETIPQSEAWLTEYLATGTYQSGSGYPYGGQLRPHFYKEEVKNKPEFDGRFFVKIIEDEALAAALRVNEETPEDGYMTVAAINYLYHLKDGTNVNAGETGQAESMTRAHWLSNLGGEDNDRWFIDETAFAGVQPANQNHPKYSVTRGGDGSTDLCDTDLPTAYANFNQGALIDWTDGSGPNSPYPNAGNAGYHAPYLEVVTRNWGTGASKGAVKLKGVHAATYDMAELADDALSGYSAGTDLYLHLSYSGINPKPNGASYTIGTPPAGDPFIARQYRQYYWDAFVQDKNWGVGVSSNSATSNQANIVKNLGYGKLFKLRGDSTIYKILGVTKRRLYNYMGKIRWDEAGVLTTINGILEYPQMWYDGEGQLVNNLHHLGGYYGAPDNKTWGDANTSGAPDHLVNTIDPPDLDGLVRQVNEFTLHTSGDPFLHYTAKHIQHRSITDPLNCRWNYLIKYEVVNDPGTQADGEAFVASNLTDNNSFSNMSASSAERLEFVEEFSTTKENVLTSYPAIFETEPKEDVGLDIYYEASGKKPTNVTSLNVHDLITIGAIMQIGVPGAEASLEAVNEGVFVTGITRVDAYPNSWRINLSTPNQADYYGDTGNNNEGTEIRFYNDDGSFAITNLQQVIQPGSGAYYISDDGTVYTRSATGATGSVMRSSIIVMMSNKIGLGWFNCWSFGNGVESNRIGDTYNKPYITNGVKASTTLLEDYKEERRKYGLIYSGIYNSTSGVNDLNQFIAAEKITKDINPIYGSIQKLHSRSTADGDLITLCEDRILKILANKDALYNADGNPQLIASNNVLGQAMPFSGEFGISKNPESFASESYRIYFTDRVRGAVMRLSKDGLTSISDHGMKDWFRDNLKLSTKLIGSYDDRNDEYNITLADRKVLGEELLKNNELVDGNFWQTSSAVSADYSQSGVLLTSSGVGGTVGTDNYPHWKQLGFNLVDGETYELKVGISDIDNGGAGVSKIFMIGNNASGGNADYRPYYDTYQNVDINSSGEYTNVFTFNQAANNNDTSMAFYVEMSNGATFVKQLRVKYVSLKPVVSDPITVSFKEDVRGWVSFKSFVPENALSMASDYYSTLGGKLYKHHIENTNRNNFYGVDYNSSVNVLLNDLPGTIKTFHALNYEGSQSRVEGIKSIEVTMIINPNGVFTFSPDGKYFWNWDIQTMLMLSGTPFTTSNFEIDLDIKQYRNNSLIYSGPIRIYNNSNGIHAINLTTQEAGDFEIGDIITTQDQEDIVNHSNSMPNDGWFASNIITDKQEGSILEFIEKEGKWFNYIKGVDSDITSDTDFGAFDIQGIGTLSSISSDVLTFSDNVNASLQIGDIIYFQTPTINGLFNTIDSSNIIKYGDVTAITNDTITVNLIDSAPVADDYIMFAKNHAINTSSLLGYFADVQFENNSTGKIELFSVGSEVTESSK